MNLSPFEMKMLLYHILSGKELVLPNGMFVSVRTDLLSTDTLSVGWIHVMADLHVNLL